MARATGADRPLDRGVFERQVASLRHRGPDDSGVWYAPGERVALGNCRLAVHDLTPAGHMPMSDPTGRLWLTFNGEIYNFRELRAQLAGLGHSFRSATDTEVLLAAYAQWGRDCLAHLDGMFAFALYDGREGADPADRAGRIFAARDRAGEKPLYYRLNGGELAVASELKALLVDPAVSRSLSLDALNAFLALGYVPGGMCMVERVRRLLPAHAFEYSIGSGRLDVWRYWAPPSGPCAPTPRARDALVAELEVILAQSVARRLVADVPVGILLSGGIDSGLITAAAAAAGGRVKTFTVSFPGETQLDEGPAARRVAAAFGTEHCELAAEPPTAELLESLAARCDEPLADPSIVPTFWIAKLTRQHVTVALGGDGGDELFGGYAHYGQGRIREVLLSAIPGALRRYTAGAARRALPLGFRGRRFLISLERDAAWGMVAGKLLFDADARRRLFSEPVARAIGEGIQAPEAHRLALWDARRTPIDRMTRLDFQSYLPDDVLTKVDRMSMAVALEVRAPWLDRAMLDFAFGRVPDRMKVAGGRHKVLPRLLAQRLLPAGLSTRPKRGFSPPLGAWLDGPWASLVRDVMNAPDPGLFRPDAFAVLRTARAREPATGIRLFAMVMFELWRRAHRIQLG